MSYLWLKNEDNIATTLILDKIPFVSAEVLVKKLRDCKEQPINF